MPYIRKATEADAATVASRLREADRNETRAALGMTPEVVLPLSIQNSPHVWAMVQDDDTPMGLFGVDPVRGYDFMGICWMVSTNDIFKHKRQLIRQCRDELDKLHDIYPLLGNHVDVRNTSHVRWLRWLGFSFLRVVQDYGVEQRPFIEFARLRK